MVISEVFPNPLVKQVIFQIRYPNLFFLESKMGDIQVQIMDKFPKSQLLIRRQLFVADVNGIKDNALPSADGSIDETARKIWKFSSEESGVELHIHQDALDISSTTHKTYNNENGNPKFRDAISSVLTAFLNTTKIPLIQRIGLRYIDECPLDNMESLSFRDKFNTCFPLDRFPLEDATDMQFRATIKRDNYSVRYVESIKSEKEKYKLYLDFDGFASNINAEKCLETTDEIHNIISQEFENSIKAPIFDYMRKKDETK